MYSIWDGQDQFDEIRACCDARCLHDAVASYVAIAARKLRDQRSVANVLQVFIRTNPFKEGAPQYQKGLAIPLPEPSSDTLRLIRVAHWGLKKIYRPGFAYQKAGVCLTDLADEHGLQGSLFSQSRDRTDLMKTMDRINETFGRGTLHSAAEGLRKEWSMKRERKTPGYTTRWDQLPVVR